MPPRIPRQCRQPACSATTTERHGYCEAHQELSSGWVGRGRGSSTERGYGWQWRKLRDYVMKRDKALCQPCLAIDRVMPAREVDHIVPKSQGGTDSMENLQAICSQCHKSKTENESKQGRGWGQNFLGA